MSKPARTGLLRPAVQTLSGTEEAIADRSLGDQSLQAFVEAVGGRAALLSALEVGARHAAVDQVLDLLGDPRYQSRSLRWICQQAGLSVADLFAAFRTAKLAEAQIKATAEIAERIGPIVSDLLLRAAPYEDTCATCEGIGLITRSPTKLNPNPDPVPCKPCRGSGRRMIAPELERQKVALELAELLRRGGGGISITQQTAVLGDLGGGTKGGDLERLQQRLSGMLTPLPPGESRVVIDADSTSDPTI